MALAVKHLLRTAATLEQALIAIENHGQRDDVLPAGGAIARKLSVHQT